MIHNEFANELGIELSYEKILSPIGDFALTANEFIKDGGLGFNITVPFKIDAFDFCEELTSNARAAGAVNTIKVQNKVIYGENTDGNGLVNDLENNTIKKFTVKETEILVARTGSSFYAFPGMCPHMEEPLDESGILNSEFLTCSKHLWQWDLKNGSSMGPAEVDLLMYKTKVEDETLNLFFEKELIYEYQEENDDDFEW